MAISAGGAEGEPMMDMNTTPLIDVMLVLLIMFIITIPVATHSVNVNLPVSTPPPPNAIVHPEKNKLVLTQTNTILWNGNIVESYDQLARYLASVAAKDVQDEIHLRPNRLAKYDTVAKALAIAQRLGVKKIGFVGNEQFLQ